MTYGDLIERNRRWVGERTRTDPEFFARHTGVHQPRYLWIGCSDARVQPDVLTQSQPGEMFVHRNIANQVVPTDNNLLAVLQYGVEVLGVHDVVVCGHEECGGIKAALGGRAPATVDQWLGHVRTVVRLHDEELASIEDPHQRHLRLVELNVIEQLHNLSRTPVVQEAWARGATLRLHGVVYGVRDGLLRDLGVTIDGSPASATRTHAHATASTAAGQRALLAAH